MIAFGFPREIEITNTPQPHPSEFRLDIIFQMLESDPEELHVDENNVIEVDLDEAGMQQLLRRNMIDAHKAFGSFISVHPTDLDDVWNNLPVDLLGVYQIRGVYTSTVSYHFASEGF